MNSQGHTAGEWRKEFQPRWVGPGAHSLPAVLQDVDACKGGVRSEHPHLSLMGPETSDTHVLQSLDCGVVC